MRLASPIFAVILLAATLPAPASAAAPYADAGLDQTVEKYTTVHLDATGSTDPDGTVTDFRWSIEPPDGTATRPDCPRCGETTFTPTQVGRYHVTVTITDDDGQTATDTLYVDVDPGDPPTLTLTGPTRLHTDQTGTYVAEVTAGAAPLQTVYWTVDGTPRNHAPTDDADTDVHRHSHQFTTPGPHTITAEVVDADGQRTTETIAVTVTHPPPDPPSDPPSNPPTDPGQPGADGARGTAAIRGPTLVTGTQPLDATYHLDATSLQRATWWKDGTRVGTGRALATTFTPGDHTLHALVTYTDGTTDVARFNDDTTTVTADPEPTLDVATLTGTGGLTTDATATDAYGNLRRLELELDGEPALTRTYSRLELRKPDHGQRLTIDASPDSIEPGTYHATLTATDARGQTTTTDHQIRVFGPPEVLRAEFTTTRELDVYHPRIAPERYTAKHVVEIKLNGANPKNLEITPFATDAFREVEGSTCTPRSRQVGDRLIQTSCWALTELGANTLSTTVTWETTGEPIRNVKNTIESTPSDPEIRIRVISGGATQRAQDWGLLVDAGNSFDPDGGYLGFIWSGGAVPVTKRGDIGKLDNQKVAKLVVRDDNGGRSQLRELIPAHFNPPVRTVTEVSTGPYLPTDTVRFVVATRPYELPKGLYRKYTTLGLDVFGAGKVVDHSVYRGEFSGDVLERGYDSFVRPQNLNNDQQFWTVEVPAKAFLSSTPEFETFNVHSRAETNDRNSFPEPVVLVPEDPRLLPRAVTTEYLVERPTYAYETTTYDERRRVFESRGFDVVESQLTGREWVFEQKKKVAPAAYRRSIRRFERSGHRRLFIEMNPGWDAAGSQTRIERVSRRVLEWRDARGGGGEFTGNTREVQVQPREYRVERQYEYEYTTTETRTRTKTKTYEYRDTVEYTVTEERCNRYIGCYEATFTREKTVTRTATKDIEVSYEVDVERTGTYWSTAKRHHAHTFTGRTSREIVQHAKYETQYEYAVIETKETRQQVYLASITRQIRPAIYEWQPFQTTRSKLVADQLSYRPDVRLRSIRPVTEWTLRKQTGTTLTTDSEYSNESRVLETQVTISGNVSVPYVNPKTGAIERIVTSHEHSEFTNMGVIDKQKAIEIYLNGWERRDKE